MNTTQEILSRLDRIEALLERIAPASPPAQEEARLVVAQGKDLADHLRDKFKKNRPNKKQIRRTL